MSLYIEHHIGLKAMVQFEKRRRARKMSRMN